MKKPKSPIKIRPQRIADARCFYEILNNPKFVYFPAKPKTFQEEVEFLQKNGQKRKDNFEHNFSILYQNKVVGAVGVKISQHWSYIGEIGYFVDEDYWNRGIATQAVKLLEKICFNQLKLKRIEIFVNPQNKASVKVALKNHYQKEGLAKRKIRNHRRRKYEDAYIFAKICEK